MPLTYHDVMTADLSPLSDVSDTWQKMGERFGALQTDYEKNVKGALANGNWQGFAFGAQQGGSAGTSFEYGAAKTEALAVASILKEAHTELTWRQKAVKDLVTEAEAKDYKVDADGIVTYVGFDKLTEKERFDYRHDPEYSSLVAKYSQAAQEWTAEIAKAVHAVDDADQNVKLALTRAAGDTSLDGGGIGGFNAHAEGGLPQTTPHGKDAGKDGGKTKTDGWHADGSTTVLGPNAGTSHGGTAYGKQGSVKAYADLGHVTAKGTLTNGSLTLSGIADANVGARASANWGFSNKGIGGTAEVSAGARALTEGRVEAGDVGVYGRATGFGGAEASASAKAGLQGVSAGAKAFAGAKGSVTGGVEAGGIGAGTTAEGWAGVGADAKVEFGKGDDGKYHFGGKVGAALGLGGEVGFEFTVDPHKVSDAAHDAADAAGNIAHDVGKVAGKAGGVAKSIGHGIGSLF
ncbi:hypothetical protein [Actinacidiphila bryophytorum]|uniref:WXG100 family type VII secretion target n=1 Tax=Actinacidiphila bryophytorum TaxID=1436133 RepID=A0A9W4GWP7_9ACTN|nr:hypothetical protein [Actinacidiphila bryophytorum]MBM9436528.1 hypothetical protein [Actinacidiphila bryophytorum]MBN6542289.1 hypothetical protein [Actinacidiphila bryophytorum]CAG7600540.1 conserved hypothetical protein [Actinacidiphila bryophytorum]